MRIIVISDTHGRYRALSSIVLRNLRADAFIHLGDGEEEFRKLIYDFPDVAPRFHYIKGNCDYGSERPLSMALDIAPGHRIFATHGHRYGVNYDLGTLIQTAKEQNCDIALYGHTHVQLCTYQEGIHIMNPGSASIPRDGRPPSYGFIDITPAGIVTNTVPVD